MKGRNWILLAKK